MHACKHARTYACTHARMCASTQASTHTCMYSCMLARILPARPARRQDDGIRAELPEDAQQQLHVPRAAQLHEELAEPDQEGGRAAVLRERAAEEHAAYHVLGARDVPKVARGLPRREA